MTNKTRDTSLLSGFYKLSHAARLEKIAGVFDLRPEAIALLEKESSLPHHLSDLFVENSLGHFSLPLGLVTNVTINGEESAVPFAVEESSVVAAASNAAKWVRQSGGFTAEVLGSLMIGQIQILDVLPSAMTEVMARILAEKEALVAKANEVHPRLLQRGGGVRDIEVRSFPHAEIPFLVVHVLLDTREAMGANLVNTVCERLAPEIQILSQGRIGLRILSNYADRRLFKVSCRVNPKYIALNDSENSLTGPEVAQRIVEAYVFAKYDPYRAATHNKGIMNGVDPVVIATGNDWRAVEAGVHAYAARSGRYESLSRWSIDADGMLVGELTLPLQLGTVGGVTRLHPLAQLSLQILGNPSSDELGMIVASTGLASNLAALRALTTTGIQAGHMKLHAKNLALAAGAEGAAIEEVASEMVRSKNVSSMEAERLVSSRRDIAGTETSI
ncbi:MAG: hydroxymethylglutaryl-CoA reductase, degradative [Bdellovibrionota bacterium]